MHQLFLYKYRLKKINLDLKYSLGILLIFDLSVFDYRKKVTRNSSKKPHPKQNSPPLFFHNESG